MLLEAAEIVLGYFGFDSTVYGNADSSRGKNGKWWHALREEHAKDIENERLSDTFPDAKRWFLPSQPGTTIAKSLPLMVILLRKYPF